MKLTTAAYKMLLKLTKSFQTLQTLADIYTLQTFSDTYEHFQAFTDIFTLQTRKDIYRYTILENIF